ncbi:hypothetical protein C2E23DRAFT_860043 [Lenzites betulinus]|nr:hypothetical protein C2E23DRAFT_860043 [Lenzites betulinus]
MLVFVVISLTLCLFAEGASNTVLIDDASSGVAYSGDWDHSPLGYDPQQNNFNSTLSSTQDSTAYAEIRFTGTAIAIYGMLAPPDPGMSLSSAVTLDQDAPVSNEPPVVKKRHYRTLLWQTSRNVHPKCYGPKHYIHLSGASEHSDRTTLLISINLYRAGRQRDAPTRRPTFQ